MIFPAAFCSRQYVYYRTKEDKGSINQRFTYYTYKERSKSVCRTFGCFSRLPAKMAGCEHSVWPASVKVMFSQPGMGYMFAIHTEAKNKIYKSIKSIINY
jgi:hypothetical protein